MTRENLRARILWTNEWLIRRKNRLDSDMTDISKISIHDTFNTLSNWQLEQWKTNQEDKLKVQEEKDSSYEQGGTGSTTQSLKKRKSSNLKGLNQTQIPNQ